LNGHDSCRWHARVSSSRRPAGALAERSVSVSTDLSAVDFTRCRYQSLSEYKQYPKVGRKHGECGVPVRHAPEDGKFQLSNLKWNFWQIFLERWHLPVKLSVIANMIFPLSFNLRQWMRPPPASADLQTAHSYKPGRRFRRSDEMIREIFRPLANVTTLLLQAVGAQNYTRTAGVCQFRILHHVLLVDDE